MGIKNFSGRVRRWGWVRSVGTALTLAGAIVVFVVLILPATATAGHPRYCAGDNTLRIFGFSPNKGKVGADGDNAQITLLGANFHEEAVDILIGNSKGKGVLVSTWDFANPVDNTIIFTIPDGAPTGAQHIIVQTSSGSAGCMAISKSTIRIS